MTTIYLVRHGAHDRLGRYLDGRNAGVHLSESGERQVERLAQRLSREMIQAVLASPLDRARETAEPIAAALGLPMRIEAALNEIDFGDWSGKAFEELKPLEGWHLWNSARSVARTPAGDTMRASQARMLDLIDALCTDGAEAAYVLVGHADPLKATIAYYLGLALDELPRFEIAPASLSRIDIDPWSARVAFLNETQPE